MPQPKKKLVLPLPIRLKSLQRRLINSSANALLVTNPRDIRYLTGFVGDDSWALVRERGQVIYVLSDFRFEEQIKREAPQVKAIMRTKSLADELLTLCLKLKIGKVALQPRYVTLAERKQIAAKLTARKLVAWDDSLLDQRANKDEFEVAAIRRAIAIQEKAYLRTLAFIEPGQTENQVAAYLEYQMRELGADGMSFPSIVAADANASLPHAIPGGKKIKQGGIVLFDWGAKFKGYCGDLTRVVAIGKMKPQLREIYQITLEAQLAAIDAIAPGKQLCEIDGIARNIISKYGYGKNFGHSLGHGIGLDIHEQPTLSTRSQGVLEAGQMVTVEPGIYLPNIGGVRIEDDILVTEAGHEILSNLPKSLESAII